MVIAAGERSQYLATVGAPSRRGALSLRIRGGMCAPRCDVEAQPGEKKRKVREMPCSGEGRGHTAREEGGGSNGLQDKPTFLNTPGVVITGAKQPNLHCG